MILEEALTALRNGAKIRHPTMEPDEYFQACIVGIIHCDIPEDAPISIVKMKGDNVHIDMVPRLPFYEHTDLIDKYPFLREKITFPTINLLLIMSDEWEVLK